MCLFQSKLLPFSICILAFLESYLLGILAGIRKIFKKSGTMQKSEFLLISNRFSQELGKISPNQ